MNTGKFCPLPLCTLIGNLLFYLYIVSLVVIFAQPGLRQLGLPVPNISKGPNQLRKA